eukprot:528517_1
MVEVLNRLATMKQQRKDVVTGYVRNYSHKNIPYPLIQICMAYYLLYDKWDNKLKGDNVEIRGIYDEIAETKSTVYQSVFGHNIISDGQHYWKLEVLQFGQTSHHLTWRLMIGICNDNVCAKVKNDYFTSAQNMSYAFVGNNYSVSHLATTGISCGFYGSTLCKSGDIIEMFVDMDIGTMKYIINSKDHGKAFDINKDEKYKLAVTISNGSAFKILSYK